MVPSECEQCSRSRPVNQSGETELQEHCSQFRAVCYPDARGHRGSTRPGSCRGHRRADGRGAAPTGRGRPGGALAALRRPCRRDGVLRGVPVLRQPGRAPHRADRRDVRRARRRGRTGRPPACPQRSTRPVGGDVPSRAQVGRGPSPRVGAGLRFAGARLRGAAGHDRPRPARHQGAGRRRRRCRPRRRPPGAGGRPRRRAGEAGHRAAPDRRRHRRRRRPDDGRPRPAADRLVAGVRDHLPGAVRADRRGDHRPRGAVRSDGDDLGATGRAACDAERRRTVVALATAGGLLVLGATSAVAGPPDTDTDATRRRSSPGSRTPAPTHRWSGSGAGTARRTWTSLRDPSTPTRSS